ncbi:4-alpha-glucanotransferase [Rodentibacter pneumotropicus]|uniref:4-alpha-glucanotransferase n=1 Tax=Rodentibacter pneumotropicus TaxID=758 RepID=A0A448MPX4_9PAST|nr:4-alpha-glucanotransferase [Rodentibacter pneumotropicus]
MANPSINYNKLRRLTLSVFSAIAGNPHLIDFDLLAQMGLLKKKIIFLPILAMTQHKLIMSVFLRKTPNFGNCSKNFVENNEFHPAFENFEKNNRTWLSDYAEFMAIKEHFGNHALQEWDDKQIIARDPKP